MTVTMVTIPSFPTTKTHICQQNKPSNLKTCEAGHHEFLSEWKYFQLSKSKDCLLYSLELYLALVCTRILSDYYGETHAKGAEECPKNAMNKLEKGKR